MQSYEHRAPWNKGKLVGQKAPLKPKDIWANRIHLQNGHQVRLKARMAWDASGTPPGRTARTILTLSSASR